MEYRLAYTSLLDAKYELLLMSLGHWEDFTGRLLFICVCVKTTPLAVEYALF